MPVTPAGRPWGRPTGRPLGRPGGSRWRPRRLAAVLPAGRRLDVADHGEAQLELFQQRLLGAALEDLGDEAAARRQDPHGEVQRQLGQRHDAQVVGGVVPGGVRRHVGQHQVGLAGQRRQHRLLRRGVLEIPLQHDGAGDRVHRQQVERHDPAAGRDAFQRHLGPAARRGAEVDHPGARLQQPDLVVDLEQLEGGARAVAAGLGGADIGVVDCRSSHFWLAVVRPLAVRRRVVTLRPPGMGAFMEILGLCGAVRARGGVRRRTFRRAMPSGRP